MSLQAPPDYAVGVDDAIHNLPAQSTSSPLDMFGQIAASVRFMVESFIGQVAIAFGGISIFGWKPFDFLAQWGQDRIAEASANYLAATSAQATANTANTNANNALTYIASFVDGVLGTGHLITDVATFVTDTAANATSAVSNLAALISSLLSNPASVLGALPQALVSGLSGALGALSSGVDGAVAFIQNVIAAIIVGIRGIPFVGGTIADMLTGLTGTVKERQIQQQNAAITNTVRSRSNPGWLCDQLVGDVSYPMILNASIPVFGNTGAATAGTAHTHPMSGLSGASSGFYSIAQNNSLGAYVPMTDVYQVDRFDFCAYVSAPLTGGTVDFETFREAPDGTLKRVGPATSLPMLTTSVQRIAIGSNDTLITRDGERYLMRIANRSSPAITVQVLGLDGSGVIGTTDAQHATVGTATTNKTSYTAAEAQTALRATTALPWMMVARAVPPPEDRTYSDDFNRVNLGPAWALDTFSGAAGAMKISGGRLVFGGTTDDVQTAMHIYPTAGDAMRVDANVWDIATSGSGNGVFLALGQDRDYLNGVVLMLFNGSAVLRSIVNAVGTDRDTWVGSTTDAKWSLIYEPTPKKWTALKGDLDIGLSWTDSAATLPHNENQRYSTIYISRVGGVNGGEVDNFELRDFAA